MSGRRDRFIALSALLTGYNKVKLLGTGMADAYLATLENAVDPAVLDELLAAEPPAVLDDDTLGPLARNVILMWYRGTWDDKVISGDAYVAGLQWNAAGAHPVGARQQGYGAWATEPEPSGP